ncbi:MAG: thiamine pyrophosphate-dependent enzyme [Bacteroidales bacterium]|jgi:pyruvate ferredoxin oxidoreductase beta subunit|nr:thiamine pyrophosphate-dependent enzyme [Bacteroidales bacterium]
MDNSVKRINAKNITDKEYFYGHKACAGCGGSLAVRLALKVLGDRTYSVLPAGCMSAVGFIYPQMAFTRNAIISTFPGSASMASGVSVANKALGKKDTHTVVFAGDGGTADIGLQALSGAIDRNDKLIYICYDNEAYMNTGIQKSGLTPYGTKTTTSPVGKNVHGSTTQKKNLFEIIAAHDIKYAATASIGYYQDFINKINKAKQVDGTSYIHVFASCPTGWGSATETAVSIAKDAVDCGLIYLAEYENGEFKLNRNPKEFKPVKDYLFQQARFKHLTDDDIDVIISARNKKWKRMRDKWQ